VRGSHISIEFKISDKYVQRYNIISLRSMNLMFKISDKYAHGYNIIIIYSFK